MHLKLAADRSHPCELMSSFVALKHLWEWAKGLRRPQDCCIICCLFFFNSCECRRTPFAHQLSFFLTMICFTCLFLWGMNCIQRAVPFEWVRPDRLTDQTGRETVWQAGGLTHMHMLTHTHKCTHSVVRTHTHTNIHTGNSRQWYNSGVCLAVKFDVQQYSRFLCIT